MLRHRQSLISLAFIVVVGLWGCGQGVGKPKEWMYVSVPQVTLRDRVAALYSKVGVVKAGDRVEILERQKKFARVRTAGGQEGWVEQRYLVDQKAFDEVQKMTADALSRPVSLSPL